MVYDALLLVFKNQGLMGRMILINAKNSEKKEASCHDSGEI
jgi:hypothetical protein